jgi:hypothetical protein
LMKRRSPGMRDGVTLPFRRRRGEAR